MPPSAIRSTLFLSAVVLCVAGCNRPSSGQNAIATLPALRALGAKPGSAIVAQGQLEPATGILSIMAPPGDRVESISVAEGQHINIGDPLGRLASQSARELELEIAIARRDEAIAKAKAEEATAIAKLDVAKVGLRQAVLAIDQAVKNLEVAESNNGRLGLLAQQVAMGEVKLNQLRAANGDRDTGRLVTHATIEQQQLELDKSRSELNAARQEAKQKIADETLSIEAAEKEIHANELAIASAKAAFGTQTMDKQIELLKLQVQTIKLISPIAATVLSIDTGPGEPTGMSPIMRIADTSKMVVRTEVNVSDLNRVVLGANATITSSAIEGTLRGKVASVSQLVGSPRLPSSNPMARVDWRSAEVTIDVDLESVEKASNRIMLQVDVAIEASDVL